MMKTQYRELSERLRVDLTNQRFNRWLVLKYARSRNRAAYWLCQCECGVRREVIAESLVSGHSKSCGCLCREEASKRMKTHGKSKTKEAALWYKAKKRAKKLGLDFNLLLEDIVIPETCPLLGIPIRLNQTKLSPNSPSLDRFNSEKGYTGDNVWVISHRANTLKNNATLEELRVLVGNMDKFHGIARAVAEAA